MREALQLKITLSNVSPTIWRRVLIRGSARLFDLHAVIQHAFGWTESHLHQFESEGTHVFGEASLDEEPIYGVIQETITPVRRYLDRPGDVLSYTYDFGDDWEHEVLVEAVIPSLPGATYPICLAGERSCPPEDCGGPGGYENVVTILNDPKHEEYEGYREWVGERFDPEAFDLPETNRMLRKYRNSYKYWGLVEDKAK